MPSPSLTSWVARSPSPRYQSTLHARGRLPAGGRSAASCHCHSLRSAPNSQGSAFVRKRVGCAAMKIERARNVGPAQIDIAYQRLGDPDAPPVLMLMGIGAQLIGWPDGLCDELVNRGLHLIRFD